MTDEILTRLNRVKRQLLEEIDNSHNVVFEYIDNFVYILIKLKSGCRLYEYNINNRYVYGLSTKGTLLEELAIHNNIKYIYNNMNVLVIDDNPEIVRTFSYLVKDFLLYIVRDYCYSRSFDIFRFNKKFIANFVDFIDWEDIRIRDIYPYNVSRALSNVSNSVSTTESNLKKAFRLSNDCIRLAITSNHLTEERIRILYNKGFSIDFIRENQYPISNLDSQFLTEPIIKCYCYCYSNGITAYYYKDYLRMRSYLPPSLSNGFPTVPKEVTAERIEELHDKITDIYNKWQSQEEEVRLKSLNDDYTEKFLPEVKKLEYSNDKYSIIACNKLSELLYEGSTLHHCVGSYTRSVGTGTEYILFLRQNEELDKPFYTIDVVPNTNTIRQIHGYRNCNVTKEIGKFIKEWAKKFKLDASSYSGCLRALN